MTGELRIFSSFPTNNEHLAYHKTLSVLFSYLQTSGKNNEI